MTFKKRCEMFVWLSDCCVTECNFLAVFTSQSKAISYRPFGPHYHPLSIHISYRHQTPSITVQPQRPGHNADSLEQSRKCVFSLAPMLPPQVVPDSLPPSPLLLSSAPPFSRLSPLIEVKQLRNGLHASPDGFKCRHSLSLRLTRPWGGVCVCLLWK